MSRPSYEQVELGRRPYGPASFLLQLPCTGGLGARERSETVGGLFLWAVFRAVNRAHGSGLFVPPRPKPICLVQSGHDLSPVKAPLSLKGEVSPSVLEALNELEDHYSFGPLTGAQGRALAIEITVSGALGPGETPMDLDIPLENLGQNLTSAGPPSGCSLSSCPDSG